MKQDKNVNSIDLFKLLMAAAVVAIHTNPIVSWTNQAAIKAVVIVEEWAVPFFFTASGFLLFRTMKQPYETQIKRIDRYLVKIVKLYCAWTLISLPLTLYGYSISGNSIISCVLSYVKYFLFVGKLYNSYHLWYLLSLIYARAAIRIMIKKRLQVGMIVGISAAVFVFREWMSFLTGHVDLLGGIGQKAVSLYQYVFNNGGIFTGLIYVSVGMLIADRHLRIHKRTGIIAIAALNGLKLLLEWGTGYGAVTQLIMPVEALLLFMTLLDVRLCESPIWEKCRKASTVIYLSHLIFFSVYTFLIIRNPNKLGFDSFIVTLTLSALNAVILGAAQQKGRFRLLKHII